MAKIAYNGAYEEATSTFEIIMITKKFYSEQTIVCD